jgi:uncharacterized protein
LELQPLAGRVSICRLDPDAPLPEVAAGAPIWAAVRTAAEHSLVVPEGAEPEGAKVDPDRRVLRVAQAHDLEVTGVTAALTAPLAEIRVPIFILAFDTDYPLQTDSSADRAGQRIDAFAGGLVARRRVPHRLRPVFHRRSAIAQFFGRLNLFK